LFHIRFSNLELKYKLTYELKTSDTYSNEQTVWFLVNIGKNTQCRL